MGEIDWTNVIMGIGAAIFGSGFWKWASVLIHIKDDLLTELKAIRSEFKAAVKVVTEKVEEVDDKVVDLRARHGERIAAVEARVNGGKDR